MDPGADVGVPGLQVAVGAGVDRGLDVGLHDARQHQLLSGAAQLGLGGDHRQEPRSRAVLLRSSERASMRLRDSPDREHQRDDGGDQRVALTRVLSCRRCRAARSVSRASASLARLCALPVGLRPCTMRKHRRHEEERRDGREYQPADDGAAERGILLTALAEAERHRDHADDHGGRRHDHRAQARESRFERGFPGAPFPRSSARAQS